MVDSGPDRSETGARAKGGGGPAGAAGRRAFAALATFAGHGLRTDQGERPDPSGDGPASASADGPAQGDRPEPAVPADFVPLARLQTPEEARRSDSVTRKRSGTPGLPKFFLLLNVGLVLTAVSIVVFKTPNHFAFGGTSGVALILNTLVPELPVSVFMWILNIALVILGLVFLDFKTVGWSVYASIALSAYTSLGELLYPWDVSPTGDMWLDLCFAVLLPAIGSALVFDVGASTGGTDIVALILKRRTSLEIGKALFVVDVGIVVVAAFLYGPRVGLYCILGLFAKTMVVDTAIESLRLRKVCTVICSRPERVEEFIVRKLDRSATISYGYGAYSGRRVTMIMSVLNRREAMRLRMYVRSIDPGAFITIVNSSEIIGRGFRGV